MGKALQALQRGSVAILPDSLSALVFLSQAANTEE